MKEYNNYNYSSRVPGAAGGVVGGRERAVSTIRVDTQRRQKTKHSTLMIVETNIHRYVLIYVSANAFWRLIGLCLLWVALGYREFVRLSNKLSYTGYVVYYTWKLQRRPIRRMLHDVIIWVSFFIVLTSSHKIVKSHEKRIHIFSPGREIRH